MGVLGVSGFFAGRVFASVNDYSVKNNPDQLKYQYGQQKNPFPSSNSKNKTTNKQHYNEILPNQGSIDEFWTQPRRLRLKRQSTGESANIVYYENGKINEDGYRLACYLLRDVRSNRVVAIDLQLLDLLSAVQAWLRHYGIDEWIIITSGYRTPEHNRSLKNSASNSMHIYGKAVDFTVPGLKPEQIANIAKRFNAGGIGIYSKNNFIHLDTGRVRSWRN